MRIASCLSFLAFKARFTSFRACWIVVGSHLVNAPETISATLATNCLVSLCISNILVRPFGLCVVAALSSVTPLCANSLFVFKASSSALLDEPSTSPESLARLLVCLFSTVIEPSTDVDSVLAMAPEVADATSSTVALPLAIAAATLGMDSTLFLISSSVTCLTAEAESASFTLRFSFALVAELTTVVAAATCSSVYLESALATMILVISISLSNLESATSSTLNAFFVFATRSTKPSAKLSCAVAPLKRLSCVGLVVISITSLPSCSPCAFKLSLLLSSFSTFEYTAGFMVLLRDSTVAKSASLNSFTTSVSSLIALSKGAFPSLTTEALSTAPLPLSVPLTTCSLAPGVGLSSTFFFLPIPGIIAAPIAAAALGAPVPIPAPEDVPILAAIRALRVSTSSPLARSSIKDSAPSVARSVIAVVAMSVLFDRTFFTALAFSVLPPLSALSFLPKPGTLAIALSPTEATIACAAV